LVKNSVIQDIASAHSKTGAQVVLRWHVQQPGTIAIPKSGNQGRIAENLNIFDFELSLAEMQRISGLARPGGRMVYPSWKAEFED
jgi:diketogulonate reductase-like aldo/keto reductase